MNLLRVAARLKFPVQAGGETFYFLLPNNGSNWNSQRISRFVPSILFLGFNKSSVLQVIRDLDLLPELLGSDWSSVFLQRFDGAVT
jgi:hypothetical protein